MSSFPASSTGALGNCLWARKDVCTARLGDNPLDSDKLPADFQQPCRLSLAFSGASSVLKRCNEISEGIGQS